jgi:CheY-like chemotaxis protein
VWLPRDVIPFLGTLFKLALLIERSFYRLYFVISYGKLLSGASMILLVEDNPNARLLFAQILSSAGHEVVESENGEEAVSLLEEHRIDLVVTDLAMPKMTGVGLLTHIREKRPSLPAYLSPDEARKILDERTELFQSQSIGTNSLP